MPGNENQTFVVVGAGLAGGKAVETLRDEGFVGRLVLLGAERERPYERPPLSKGYLAGDSDRESIYVHPAEWYEEHSVDMRLGDPAASLDVGAHHVVLDSGERLTYDKLLLATGSAPRKLRIPGADLDGVLYLRRVGDSDRIREAVAGGGHVVLVGGGWIGLEVAAVARQAGAQVTIVEPEATPLNRVLGPEMGQVFADLHREHGVELVLGEGVERLRGEGRVDGVVTSAGNGIDADVVVIGVGAVPMTRLAEQAGLDVDNGVLVDASLRTSDPDVYAAGDIANAFNPLFGTRVRVEHWANALNSGPAAARAMLGQDVVYDRVPYFYSDQYDLGMEYSGYVAPGSYDDVVVRGDLSSREFVAFWTKQGRVLAGMNVNVWDVTGPIQALVRSGASVEADKLADPDVRLDSLAGP